MTTPVYIKNVAIVGAGGNSGRFITKELLSTGKHTVTAITRHDSQSKMPKDVTIKKVDYDSQETLVEALRDQDALIITLSGRAAIDEIEMKLVHAAEEAGVSWILRNEWGPDTANEELVKDVSVFQPKGMLRDDVFPAATMVMDGANRNVSCKFEEDC